eukprot:CAMPEP_0183797432 /NCGR_PEP_ID=MMETSP0803_2-20130417/15778_1 /TAXON_ID=195967 /ORGANISM="Crustomastix stigmata, Strain CCMP3273" /LENGTH=762 /DNA_ID=CAMNT_0026042101 /DNA_START=245 /DNA_END=2533 /DNA_ORIENTATION=+
MNATGIVHSPMFGFDFVGVVVKCGCRVNRSLAGKTVIGYASESGCFSQLIVTRVAEVRLMDESANALSELTMTNLGTVELSLGEYPPSKGDDFRGGGALQQGERILIHAASGGVGLLAIQFAKSLGCVIYATTSSERKSKVLRSYGVHYVFSSRDPESFRSGIAQVLGAQKIDLVLNSLTGKFIKYSLELLGPSGRFVELGRTELYNPRELESEWNIKKYVIIKWEYNMADSQQLCVQQIESVIASKKKLGLYRPLPVKLFDFVLEYEDAFALMRSGTHVGKLVFQHGKYSNHFSDGLHTNDELHSKVSHAALPQVNCLLDSWVGISARIARTIIHVLGLRLKIEQVDVLRGDNQTKTFAKMNADYTLPVLKFNNQAALSDTLAIAWYLSMSSQQLSTLFGHTALRPKLFSLLETCDKWNLCTSILFFNRDTEWFSKRNAYEHYEAYSCISDKLKQEANNCIKAIISNLRTADRKYLICEHKTYIDYYFALAYDFLQEKGVVTPLQEYLVTREAETFASWFNNMMEDKSVRKTYVPQPRVGGRGNAVQELYQEYFSSKPYFSEGITLMAVAADSHQQSSISQNLPPITKISISNIGTDRAVILYCQKKGLISDLTVIEVLAGCSQTLSLIEGVTTLVGAWSTMYYLSTCFGSVQHPALFGMGSYQQAWILRQTRRAQYLASCFELYLAVLQQGSDTQQQRAGSVIQRLQDQLTTDLWRFRYLGGDSVSYADILLYCIVKQTQHFYPLAQQPQYVSSWYYVME